jgi:hypothetical protein
MKLDIKFWILRLKIDKSCDSVLNGHRIQRDGAGTGRVLHLHRFESIARNRGVILRYFQIERRGFIKIYPVQGRHRYLVDVTSQRGDCLPRSVSKRSAVPCRARCKGALVFFLSHVPCKSLQRIPQSYSWL